MEANSQRSDMAALSRELRALAAQLLMDERVVLSARPTKMTESDWEYVRGAVNRVAVKLRQTMIDRRFQNGCTGEPLEKPVIDQLLKFCDKSSRYCEGLLWDLIQLAAALEKESDAI